MNSFRKFLGICVASALFIPSAMGLAQAGVRVPGELVGKVIHVDHEWSRSQHHGEFAFSADRVAASGDFVSVRDVKILSGVVTIRFGARIYNKVRSSSLTWALGQTTGTMTIHDCENNCTNPVKITEQSP